MLGGMPVYIPEMERELDNGDIQMGCTTESCGEPNWQCTECGAQFFRERSVAEKQS